MKTKEPTDTIAFETTSFKITTANMMLFKAFQNYSKYLDLILNTRPDESVGSDTSGLFNFILESALTKELKDIQKRHGFTSFNEMVQKLIVCKSPEEVCYEIQNTELEERRRFHQRILEQIPEEDRQFKLFDTGLKQV